MHSIIHITVVLLLLSYPLLHKGIQMKILVIIFLSLFLGCRSISEETNSVSQAQNGGQICAGTYNPFSPSYPFPSRGWCQWMPWPAGNSPGPSPNPCVGPLNGKAGLSEVIAYSWTSTTPIKCAYWPKNTDMDFQHMAYNGWNNVELDGTLRTIRTVHIGPHTYWEANNGEYFNGNNRVIFANPYDTNMYSYNLPANFQMNSTMNYSYYGSEFIIQLPNP